MCCEIVRDAIAFKYRKGNPFDVKRLGDESVMDGGMESKRVGWEDVRR